MWIDIRESISGTERDFTTDRLSRAIFVLSVPMVLEMAMESLFAVVDIFFVSKLGADTVAVVGITESLMTLFYALAIGIGTAATAIISRRTGEKDTHQASRSAGQAIITGALISVILALPCMLYYRNILAMMGISPSLAEQYGSFTMIIMGSNVVIMMLFINNAIFRSSGDAAISMRVLWLANILNIILDPILIFGLGPIPALGIKGAAIATTTGRSIGVIYQFYILFTGKHRVSLKIHALNARLVHYPEPVTTNGRCNRTAPYCYIKLDFSGQDYFPVRKPGNGRLHYCIEDHVLYADAFMGNQQCGSDAGRTEPGRR